MVQVLNISYSISPKSDKMFFSDEGTGWNNINRSEIALLGLVVLNDSTCKEVKFAEISYDTTLTNQDVTSFTADYDVDGWYSIAILVIPTSASESEGSVRFDVASSSIQIYTSSAWVTIPTKELYRLLININILKSSVEVLLHSKILSKMHCIWLDIANNKCKDKKCSEDAYWFLRGQIFSALYMFSGGNRLQAAKIISNSQKVVDKL